MAISTGRRSGREIAPSYELAFYKVDVHKTIVVKRDLEGIICRVESIKVFVA